MRRPPPSSAPSPWLLLLGALLLGSLLYSLGAPGSRAVVDAPGSMGGSSSSQEQKLDAGEAAAPPAHAGRGGMPPRGGVAALVGKFVVPRGGDAPAAAAAAGREFVRVEELEAAHGKVRVLRPGAMMTMDYVPSRLNVHIDEDGRVLRVNKG